MAHTYQVGRLFDPDQTSYEDGTHLAIDGDINVVVTLASPTAEEVGEFVDGQALFAWVDGEHLGLLCVRFGDLPWWDAPFTPHLNRTPADLPGSYRSGAGQVVIVFLVDGATGVIVAIRGISWPAEFVDAVGTTVARLMGSPPSLRAHDAALAGLYARYPTSEDLQRDRADMTCVGGTTDVDFGHGVDASPR